MNSTIKTLKNPNKAYNWDTCLTPVICSASGMWTCNYSNSPGLISVMLPECSSALHLSKKKLDETGECDEGGKGKRR